MDSKAEVGLGSLIIFITLTMVVAIAVGVAFQNTESIGLEITSQSQRGKADISTALVGMELTGDGAGAHAVDTFRYRFRMAPADGIVEFENMVLMFHTGNFTNALSFGGTAEMCRNNNSGGYNTIEDEEVGRIPVFDGNFFDQGMWLIGPEYTGIDLDLDFDGDGVKDEVVVCKRNPSGVEVVCPSRYRGTSIMFNFSRDGRYYVELVDDDGDIVNLSAAEGFNITRFEFGDYGYLKGSRTGGNADADAIRSDDDWTDEFRIYGNTISLEENVDEYPGEDSIAVNRTHVFLFLSSLENPLTYGLGTDLSAPGPIDVTHTISDGSEDYGTLTIDGTTTEPDVIDADVEVSIEPSQTGKGTYCVSYDSMSSRDIEDGLESGDVATITFESSQALGESEVGELILSHKIGHTHRLEFETPDVIHDETLLLYP